MLYGHFDSLRIWDLLQNCKLLQVFFSYKATKFKALNYQFPL